MVDKVVGRVTLVATVVAEDALLHVAKLVRHGVGGQQAVQHAEVHAHVAHALGANRAGVVPSRVLGEACGVHEMATPQFLYGLVTVKQIVFAHGADTLDALLPALVPLEQAHVHAGVALHAVEEIQSEALASAANIAEGAVIDLPLGRVIKQVADAAVVFRHRSPAAAAGATNRLALPTHHAHH